MSKPGNFILYIEDDEGIAKLVRSHLEKFGYMVEVANSAESGLGVYDPNVHSAILLDYMLPGISGIEALAKLSPNKYNPPVIILTAAGSEKTAVEAIKLGAAEYIIKDTSGGFISLLLIAIESAIAKRNLYKENEQLRSQYELLTKEISRLQEEAKTLNLEGTAFSRILERLPSNG